MNKLSFAQSTCEHPYSTKTCQVCGHVFCYDCSGPQNVDQGSKYEPDHMECPRCGHDYYDVLTFSQAYDAWRSMHFHDRCRAHSAIGAVMETANKSYTDGDTEGNYLTDFIRDHGEETAVEIEFLKGTPRCAGLGIVLLGGAE